MRGWGYIGPHWENTVSLLIEEALLDLPRDNDDRLLSELESRLDENVWCERSPYGPNDDEFAQVSWDRFRNIVAYHRRFFFANYAPQSHFDEGGYPIDMLQTIFEYAQHIGLFKTLPKGTQLFRARWEGSEVRLETPQELGPPPRERATQTNRMSPPGVVMFYACKDDETALLETAKAPDSSPSGALRRSDV